MLVAFFMCIGAAVAQDSFGVGAEFACPQERTARTGFYPDPSQCDRYYICEPGKPAKVEFCLDGLIFNDALSPSHEKCEYPFNVDRICNEAELQPPKGTELCYRQNGLFAHEEPTNCQKYYECVGNTPHPRTCPQDNVFNEITGQCDWLTEEDKKYCVEYQDVLQDGFFCAKDDIQIINGVRQINTLHPHLDCRFFYVCQADGVPMKLGCVEGLVFNNATNQCDQPDNVPHCINYYGDAPF